MHLNLVGINTGISLSVVSPGKVETAREGRKEGKTQHRGLYK
jgi:hypothetical protein